MAEFKTQSILPMGIFCIKYFMWDAAISMANRDNAAVTNTLLMHKF